MDHHMPPKGSISHTRRKEHIHAGHPPRPHTMMSISCSVVLSLLLLLVSTAQAVLIPFQNCLDTQILDSQLAQWDPLWLDAKFTESDEHRLTITSYGNITGQGNITDQGPEVDGKSYLTTLFTRFNVLTYTPYTNVSSFCEAIDSSHSCPLAPVFHGNASDLSILPAFTVAHDFESSYAMASFQGTFTVQSGDEGTPIVACVSAIVTPDLGNTLSNVFRYVPVTVLIMVAIATVVASTLSPKGSTDIFRWTSNYGREEELLRLVTPGFGDCLQYIQFIVLAGSLTLNYPGYYQPVVSKVSWSALMFNESFVSHGPGTQNPVDGIYATNASYGMERMSQLVGMTEAKDVWACMVIWALVIVAFVILACQLGFFSRWLLYYVKKSPQEDLRRKNWPFTGGNMVRLVCNFLLLPIVALSMFQMLVTTSGPAILSVFAAILLVAIVCFAGWLLRVIFTTKPRSMLFDDLPTVLLYGPLYNTYSDEAAPFALIPVVLTFLRGVAIGAVQPSGVAQLVILAICEVNLILTLYAFRPFHAPTSMNAYHTFFAFMRLVTLLLSVAFVPGLGVTEPSKGWIGYVILLLHAIVLIFGFLLNAIQTLLEVLARRVGAGNDDSFRRGGLNRVFGMRQLSKRAKRPTTRASIRSDAMMLTKDDEANAFQNGNRSRSLSASSAILLNRRTTSEGRISTFIEPNSPIDEYDPSREQGAFTYLPTEARYVPGPRGAPTGYKTTEPTDPYYRPPRPRRPTGELSTGGGRARGSWSSADVMNRAYDDPPEPPPHDVPAGQKSYVPGSVTPVPVYLRTQRDDVEANAADPRRSQVDYAVRESDFYYGVRGPALNNQPTRKLKTGPADPVGPVSSATGWFKGMLGWKTKDKGKGFEVVRSAKAPPSADADEAEQARSSQPYHDSPELEHEVVLPGQRTRSTELDRTYRFEEDGHGSSSDDAPSPLNSDDERELKNKYGRKRRSHRVSAITDAPPTIDLPIESGGAIELPSRFNSQASSYHPSRAVSNSSAPSVPRKSSRRDSKGNLELEPPFRLPTVIDSPVPSPSRRRSSNPLPPLPPEATTTSAPDSSADAANGPLQTTVTSGATQTSSTTFTFPSDQRARLDVANIEPGNRESELSTDTDLLTHLHSEQPAYSRVPRHQTSDSISSSVNDPAIRQSSAAEVVNEEMRPDSEVLKSGHWPL